MLRSLQRLRLERLTVCLPHREDDLRFCRYWKNWSARGLDRRCGRVAGQRPVFLAQAASARFIQLYNVVEFGWSDAFWPTAQKNDIRLFSRSVYPQGLPLMPEEKIRPGLAQVIPVRRRLERIALEAGCTMTELCMRYVLSNPAVTSVLTACGHGGANERKFASRHIGPVVCRRARARTGVCARPARVADPARPLEHARKFVQSSLSAT